MKFTLRPKQLSGLFLRLAAVILLSGCGADDPITPARYAGPDALYEQIDKSVKEASELAYYVDIDHSRLAAEHDVVMPPAHVLLASAPALEKALMALDPRLGLELPLRALAFETSDGEARVAFNDWEFIQQRYGLSDASRIGAAYTSAMAAMLAGVPKASLHQFPSNQTSQDSIVTLDSVHDFATTIKRARAAISGQGDTVWFGEIDLPGTAAAHLMLFGGPAPGGKAMATAPSLGLDAFCQKLLVWRDPQGVTHLSFNNLLALARRQDVPINIPLRIIDYRLRSTFKDVASAD